MIPIRDQSPRRFAPVMTWSLIGINVMAFFFEVSLSEETLQRFVGTFGFVPARLTQAGAVRRIPHHRKHFSCQLETARSRHAKHQQSWHLTASCVDARGSSRANPRRWGTTSRPTSLPLVRAIAAPHSWKQ